MKSFVFLAGLLLSQAAAAADLIIVGGSANARKGSSVEVLIAEAKEEALSKLPSSDYIQVSKWGTWVVAVGPQLYAGADASFVKSGDLAPHTITITEDRNWARNREEVSEFIEKSKESVIAQAQFYCDSEVLQLTRWKIKTTPRDGFPDATNIETSARFQCIKTRVN